MRQLNVRIDDQLHERLKERANAEGQTLNAFVIEALGAAVEPSGERARLRERLRRSGKLAIPPVPGDVPTLDEVIASTRGAGTAISEALDADRGGR